MQPAHAGDLQQHVFQRRALDMERARRLVGQGMGLPHGGHRDQQGEQTGTAGAEDRADVVEESAGIVRRTPGVASKVDMRWRAPAS